jgi:hypothetical protein
MDYYFSDPTHFLTGWVGLGAGLWVGPNKSTPSAVCPAPARISSHVPITANTTNSSAESISSDRERHEIPTHDPPYKSTDKLHGAIRWIRRAALCGAVILHFPDSLASQLTTQTSSM